MSRVESEAGKSQQDSEKNPVQARRMRVRDESPYRFNVLRSYSAAHSPSPLAGEGGAHNVRAG